MAKNATAGNRKPRTKAPENETKSDKFKRLANQRVNKGLSAIRNLANLSGSAYEYTADQVSKIETVLTGTVKATIDALRNPRKAASKDEFSV